MQAFRNMIKGWFGKVILGLVIVLFVVAGAEALFSVLNRPKPVATVNGDEISQQQLARGIEVQRQNMLRRMGEKADPSLINDELLRGSVVETLVNRLLMQQAVKDYDLAISDLQLQKEITQIPAFQVDGKFSQSQFERVVRQSGFGPKQFVKEVGTDLVVGQLKDGISASAFVTQDELKSLIALERQTRDVAVMTVKHDKYKSELTVSDEEINSYYEENKERYKTPEAVKAKYFTINVQDYVTDMDVTEEEIKDEYQVFADGLKGREERKSAHILAEITDKQDEDAARAKIEDVKKKLDAGENFSELAKQYSDDLGSKESGGDLGFAGKGVFTGEFEDALFAMNVNDVSDIVQTEFGFHIIRLDEIKKPEIPTLEEKRNDIVSQLKERKAEDIYYEKIEELKTLAFESGDLEEPAKAFNKEIKTSDWIMRTGNTGLFGSGKIASALFEDQVLLDRANTDVLEIDGQKSLVARVIEHKPASTKPLAEVKDSISEALLAKKATEKAKEVGEAILAKLNEGASTADVELEFGLQWKVVAGAKRRSPDLGFEVAQRAFEMPKPKEDAKSIDGFVSGRDYSVVVLTAVKDGAYDLSENEEKQLRSYLANQEGQEEFSSFVRHLRNNAEVEINKPKT